MKGKAFQKLWSPVPPDTSAIKDLLRRIRLAAEEEPLPPITADMVLKAAAHMKPRAGLGIDRLPPVDFQRVPKIGLAELVLILEAIENRMTWPIQTSMIVVKLTPKKSGTDRGIGLVSMIGRLWSKIRECEVQDWSQATAQHTLPSKAIHASKRPF